MGTTPVYHWPYPELNNPPDGATQMKNLALAIEPSMKGIADRVTTLETVMPVCQVRQTVAQSIPNNVAAYTGLTWNVDDIDPLDMHTGAGSRMTVKVPGVYRLAGLAGFAQNATGNRRAGWFVNDGIMPQSIAATTGTTQGVCLVLGSPMVQLAVNDWVELRVFQDSGAALNMAVGNGNQSWASMEWIRP
jgi:hypothetical protein